MTKIKRTMLIMLFSIFTLCFSALALTACGSKDYTVTFNIEGKTQTADVTDGKVSSMPADPEKEYYNFMGWYTTETFDEGTEFTADTEVTGDITVYAYFSPIKVSISVNGGTAERINLENLTTETTEYTATAEGQNLTFDGWYIDSSYTTKYTSQSADNLYARYMATVTFNNGYEDVYTYQVTPGTTISQPATSDIQKFYMSEEDIYYVYTDTNGDVVTETDATTGEKEMKEVDFTQTVTAETNMTFTVVWKTPGLSYSENSADGNLYVNGGSTIEGEDYKTYPVISIPRKVTVDGKVRYVDGINQLNSMASMTSLEKIIFQYGIKEILNFNGNNYIESIEIPGSVKIINDSFFYFSSLKSVTIDEGVECIFNSFFANNDVPNTVSIANRTPGEQYTFDIQIPDSVINISSAPTNFKFSSKSCFTNDGKGRIYQTEGTDKILIADTNVKDGVLTVEDGTTLIQVGTFAEFYARYGLTTLYLPTSWTGVRYNESATEYDWDFAGKATYLYKENYKYYSVDIFSISVLDCMENMDYVVIPMSSLPDDIGNYVFTNKSYNAITTTNVKSKISLTGSIDSGDSVTIYVVGTNTTTGVSTTYTISDKKSGDALTADEVKTAIGATASYYENFVYTQLGETYTFGTLSANQYLAVSYNYEAGGYTTEVSGNEVTIKAYDQSSAIYNESTGKYSVVIPAEIDGKAVTKIAAEAFKDVTAIEAVYIPSSVKEIGASAFSGTTSLATVSIRAGGLEKIGDYAFYNSGFTTITLPLAKLTDLGEYAFKSEKLTRFYAAEGEESRNILPYNMDKLTWVGDLSDWNEAVIGQYYFVLNDIAIPGSAPNYGCIVKYIGKTENYTVPGGTDKVTLLDVQLVATAGAATNELNLGFYFRNVKKSYYSSYLQQDVVLRYEVMEGSVYYRSSSSIVFGVISEIHTNAFTDMGDNYTSTETDSSGSYKYNYFIIYVPDSGQTYYQAEQWLDADKIKDLTSDIFEEGWWEGWTASANAEDYAILLLKMGAATTRAFSF